MIANFDAVVKKLRKEAADKLNELDAEMEKSMKAMVSKAIVKAPEATGQLKQNISFIQNGPLSYTLIADTPYAAYVEFGTGPQAGQYVPRLEQEFQDIAKDYFVNGEGKTGPKPYFYPSIQEELPVLMENLKRIAND
jgi:HK97 gp10 family phage protein